MRATIHKIKSNGLEVLIQNEAQEASVAWLPSGEWSGNTSHDWQDATLSITEGDELEVVAVPTKSTSRMIVSRKRVQAADVIDSIGEGAVGEVTVTEVAKRLIRGTIDYNCPAVVPQESYQNYLNWIADKKLPPELSDHFVLGKGDLIGGFLSGVSRKYSPDHDAVLVELTDYMDVRNDEIAQEVSQSARLVKEETEASRDADRTIPKDVVPQISPVLLIDDSGECQRLIANMLTREGVEVYIRKNVLEAQEFLDKFSEITNGVANGHRFKLAIVDPNLEEDSTDLFGLVVAARLNSETDCRIILMTGEVEHAQKLAQWPTLKIHGYIAKPFNRADLIEEIVEACNVKEPITLSEMIGIEEKDSPAESPVRSGASRAPEEVSVNEALQQLSRLKTGTILQVFSLHPRSFRARSEGQWGGGINWEQLRGKIPKSVIKDTAIDRIETLEANAGARDKPRHFWTQRMIKYQSFLGEPIYVRGKRVALVAFHPEKNAFNEKFVMAARLAAEQVGRAMERDMVNQTSRKQAELASFGMALASLAHELTSDMTALNINLDDLAALASKNLQEPTTNDQARKVLEEVRKDFDLISTKTKILRGSQTRPEPISIVDCLKQAAVTCNKVISQEIKNSKILIKIDNSTESWLVNIPAASLIIVFFNLYLNAAQQIDLASSIRKFGLISHSLSRYEDAKGKAWARVRITDTGPGIHFDDWERVFEPGYTTKTNGSGLGLYICRHLLREHQSSLMVTSSTIWNGTTMTVNLPLVENKASNQS